MAGFHILPLEIITKILLLLGGKDIANLAKIDWKIQEIFEDKNQIIKFLTLRWGNELLPKKCRNLDLWSFQRFVNVWQFMYDITINHRYFKNSTYTGRDVHNLIKKRKYKLGVKFTESQFCVIKKKEKPQEYAWVANTMGNPHCEDCKWQGFCYHMNIKDESDEIWFDFNPNMKTLPCDFHAQ